MRPLRSAWLGTVPYAEAFALQTALHERRAQGEVDDTLLLLEHPSVYTIGRRGSPAEVLWDADTLRSRGVEVVETDRGGQVTYHGPGQLVGYPIVHLGPRGDLVKYLRDLEEAMIRTLARWDVAGERVPGDAGVWVGAGGTGVSPGSAKIGAVGVRVTRGVTKHGFALNLSCDLAYFGGIVPCGILDRGVTSVEALRGSAPTTAEAASVFEECFADVFGSAVERAPVEVLTS